MTINVLMSTYNGERYLKEQIDSILNQEGVEVILWIRDDGSKDGTVAILKEYERKFKNVHICFGTSLGVGRSFMGMLFELKTISDYYAFSDQDDIWDRDKLICATKRLLEYQFKPALYVCNQRCINANGEFLYIRFPNNFQSQELHNVLFANYYAGCTMVFNNELKNMLCDIERRPNVDFFQYRIHDAWISNVASLVGVIIYDSECHMAFRRHDSNVSESIVRRYQTILIEELFRVYEHKIKRIFNNVNYNKRGVSLTAENLLNGYLDFVDKDNRELLEMVIGYRKSMKKRIKLLFGKTIDYSIPESKWITRCKVILNML